jgi:hypothetical protein
VGDEDGGRVARSEREGDLVAQVAAQRGVEVRERLVEQDDPGLGGERAGQRDALLFAPGQRLDPGAAARLEVDQREQLAGAGPVAGAERDVLLDRQVREQREALEDEADPAALGRHHAPGLRDHLAVEGDAACVEILEAGDQAQGRALARSRRAEQREHLAGRDAEGDVLDHSAAAEALVDAFEDDDRRRPLAHRPSGRRAARPSIANAASAASAISARAGAAASP